MNKPSSPKSRDVRAAFALCAITGALAIAPAHARTPVFHPAPPHSPTQPFDWPEQKVVASNGQPHDAFGQSIALAGTTALIGAVDVNGWEGAVYVFTQNDDIWTEGQEFMADDGEPGDQATFGTAIMIDGDTAVIGALGATVNGHANQGAAYVFARTDGIWNQVAKLVADDGDENNYFGQAAAISGDNVVVGAYGATVNGNALQGAAYVYSNVGGTWTFVKKLVADDAVGGEFFGRSVAMSGTRAIVGAPYAGVDGTPARGAVYVFNGSTADWTQTAKLVADSGDPGDAFGFSLAATPTHIAVGANGSNGAKGGAFVFADDGGEWQQVARLVADDGVAGDDAGYAIAIDGTTVVVGADRAQVGAATQQGAAYVFSQLGDDWLQIEKLVASDSQTDMFYGAFVALSDTTALVGVPYATVDGDAVRGAAYFYQRGDVVTDRIFADGFDVTS
ncbi:MAG TPA: hypothetical protein VHC92_08940 [Rhodanobacteraceae bacterium]|nr:hypothetical protein [Rhodanobacteraceae bacterium]